MFFLILFLDSWFNVIFNFILHLDISWLCWYFSFSSCLWSILFRRIRTDILILGILKSKLFHRISIWVLFLVCFYHFLRCWGWFRNIFCRSSWRQTLWYWCRNFSCGGKCSIHIATFGSLCWLRFWRWNLFLWWVVIKNRGLLRKFLVSVFRFLFLGGYRLDAIWRLVRLWSSCWLLFTHI